MVNDTIGYITEMSGILIDLRIRMSKFKIIKKYITSISIILLYIFCIVLHKVFGHKIIKFININSIFLFIIFVLFINMIIKIISYEYKINNIYDEFIADVLILECEYNDYYYSNQLIRHMEDIVNKTINTTLNDIFDESDARLLKSTFKINVLNKRNDIWKIFTSSKEEMNKNE